MKQFATALILSAFTLDQANGSNWKLEKPQSKTQNDPESSFWTEMGYEPVKKIDLSTLRRPLKATQAQKQTLL